MFPRLKVAFKKEKEEVVSIAPGVERDTTVLGAELYPEALGGGEYLALGVELIHPMSLVLRVDPVLRVEDQLPLEVELHHPLGVEQTKGMT